MRINLSRPHLTGQEGARIAEALASNYLAPAGPQIDAFEDRVARYLGEGVHCVALNSATAALHLALRLSGVGPGDEVWVSSATFAGGIFPVLYQGGRVRLFDCDPASWTIDTALVVEALDAAARAGRLPKVIVPTDLYGASVNLAPLEAAAARHGVRLIVDSAESLGATCGDGRRAGTGGDAAVISFNGNKIITTSGGGILATRSARMAEQALFLSLQAREDAPHYEHKTFGYNYRLSNISAAIGLAQMEALDLRVAQRRAVFDRYRAALSRPGITFMPEPAGFRSSRWLTTLAFDPEVLGVGREDVRLMLRDHGIEARPMWKPMHRQPLFAGAPYVGRGFDEWLFANGLCLPSGSDLTAAEQGEVIDRIAGLLERPWRRRS